MNLGIASFSIYALFKALRTANWHFENVYSNSEAALETLDQHYALLTPEFST